MKALQEMIAEKREQVEKLQTEISVLEAAIHRAAGGKEPPKKRAIRSNVKGLVFSLLEAVRENGLNAVIAVEMAKERGEHLERGSVSSLLSRLKNEGTVVYDGSTYKLSQFSNHGNSEDGNAPKSENVFAYPASKAAS